MSAVAAAASETTTTTTLVESLKQEKEAIVQQHDKQVAELSAKLAQLRGKEQLSDDEVSSISTFTVADCLAAADSGTFPLSSTLTKVRDPQGEDGRKVEMQMHVNIYDELLSGKTVIASKDQHCVTVTDPETAEEKVFEVNGSVLNHSALLGGQPDVSADAKRFGDEFLKNAAAGECSSIFFYGVSGKAALVNGILDHLVSNVPSGGFVLDSYIIHKEQVHDALAADHEFAVAHKPKLTEKGYALTDICRVNVSTASDFALLRDRAVARSNAAQCRDSNGTPRCDAHLVVNLSLPDGSATISAIVLGSSARSLPSGEEVCAQEVRRGNAMNLSLCAWGNLFYSLTHQKKRHIGFRDSKLTLLQWTPLLLRAGHWHGVFSCDSKDYSESLSTLRFQDRFRLPGNGYLSQPARPRVLVDPVAHLQHQIEMLREGCASHVKAMETAVALEDNEKK